MSAMQTKGNGQNAKPLEVVKRMLSDTYDSLEKKDMSKEAFISECVGELASKMKRKNSPLLLPGEDF